MYLLGGGLTDDIYQPTRPMLNQPANLEAIQWYLNLSSEFMLTPKAINTSEIGQMVAGGQCGFWMNSLEPLSLSGLAPGTAAPLPLPVAEVPFSVIAEEGYAILANSQHPDEAWKWIGFLLQQESASGGLIPPLKASIESAEYRGRVSPQVLAVARSLYGDNVVLSLELQRNERMGRTLDLFYRALQQTAQGNSDLQAALDEAQESALRAFP
jgi:ABC-type glycerol-3-phosphate transport system substrate-binding protein